MRNPEELVWINLPLNFYWTSYVSGFMVGENGYVKAFETSYKTATYPAIFDSGTSLIYIPNSKHSPDFTMIP
jgi:hypothetical protein